MVNTELFTYLNKTNIMKTLNSTLVRLTTIIIAAVAIVSLASCGGNTSTMKVTSASGTGQYSQAYNVGYPETIEVDGNLEAGRHHTVVVNGISYKGIIVY